MWVADIKGWVKSKSSGFEQAFKRCFERIKRKGDVGERERKGGVAQKSREKGGVENVCVRQRKGGARERKGAPSLGSVCSH